MLQLDLMVTENDNEAMKFVGLTYINRDTLNLFVCVFLPAP